MIVQQHYEKNKDAKKLSVRQHYEENKNAKILCVLQCYEENKDAIKLSVRQHYEQNKDAKKLSVKQYYERNKVAKLVMRKLYYQQNKSAQRFITKTTILATEINWHAKLNCFIPVTESLLKQHSSVLENTMPETELVYVLAKGADIIWQSQSFVQQQYVFTAKKALLHNKKVMKEVINNFKSQQEGAFEKMNKCSRTAAIAQVAVHKLIAKALQIHKQYVGL